MASGVLNAMKANLNFYPAIDLFASKAHHQLPAYFSAEPNDPDSLGYNAFAYKWIPAVKLYANPPWTLIPKVLAKIQRPLQGLTGYTFLASCQLDASASVID